MGNYCCLLSILVPDGVNFSISVKDCKRMVKCSISPHLLHRNACSITFHEIDEGIPLAIDIPANKDTILDVFLYDTTYLVEVTFYITNLTIHLHQEHNIGRSKCRIIGKLQTNIRVWLRILNCFCSWALFNNLVNWYWYRYLF